MNNFLTDLKTDLVNSLQSKGKIASGQTIQQIAIITDGNKSQLQMPVYLAELEKGRGPTGKNPIAGSPPMIDRIRQWCRAKGIPDQAVWAVKTKIDKVGYAGKPGLLSEPLGDANINLRLNQTSEKIADNIVTQILNNIHI